jgi:hypothetical protein
MPELKEISSSDKLPIGTKVEFHYKYRGPDWTWLRAMFAAMIDTRTSGLPGIYIGRVDYNTDGIVLHGEVVAIPEIAEPTRYEAGFVSGAAIIAAAGAVLGGIAWLLLDKTYQVIETPAGRALSFGVLALVLVAAVFVLANIKAISRRIT